MAPNLSALLVYEGTIPDDILNQMATDNIAKQLSVSYVFGHEGSVPTDPIFQEFAAQGQSLFASSGDGGAFSPPNCTSNCFYSLFPAEGPYVTAVGGTELTTNGPGGAWMSEIAWPESGGGINSGGLRHSQLSGSAYQLNEPRIDHATQHSGRCCRCGWHVLLCSWYLFFWGQRNKCLSADLGRIPCSRKSAG